MAAPWTSWWQRNYFAELLPWLRETMATHTMQFTVVAIGVITAAVGASDLWLAFSGRHTRRLSSPDAQDS